MVGGPFAWGRGDVQRMLPFRPWVVSRWLEARVGGEGVYGNGGAFMRGLELVVVAPRVGGDDDVWCWYVVEERGAGVLFDDARCCVPCFGCCVVGHEDVDGQRIVGREVEVRYGWMDGVSREV